MSFFGRLFGTEKSLNTAVEAVRDGLDALVYTDEEKAQDAAKARTEARNMVVRWMEATQGQNLARRLLALSIGLVWLGLKVLSVLLGMVAVFVDNLGAVTAEKLNSVALIASQGSNDMESAVMLILAFYFAAPHMGQIANAVTNKFAKKVNENG